MAALERHWAEFPARAPYAGTVLWFPSKSLIGQSVARGEIWDKAIVDLLRVTQIAPRTIVEVGSNVGASLLPILEAFPSAKAIAIEPSHRYAPYLRRNVGLNPLVTIVDDVLVAGDHDQEFCLRSNATTGTPSKADYGPGLKHEQVVRGETLDSLVERYISDKIDEVIIDFLKVDTDGFEMEVFRGAQDVVHRYQPLIFTEFSPPSLARIGNPEELIRFLKDKMGCRAFLTFSASGSPLGWASTFEEIMCLKGDGYYVDLYTAPRTSRHWEALCNYNVMPAPLGTL